MTLRNNIAGLTDPMRGGIRALVPEPTPTAEMAAPRGPSVLDELKSKRDIAERRLDALNNAIREIESRPELERKFQMISNALYDSF